MAKNVTLADIAAEVGVSSVAVYKALADKPGVSDKLRKKIKEVAKEMGYTNGTSAKVEASKETRNIGVIIPELYYGYSTTFYGQLYEKVVRALYKSEYFGILELLSSEDEKSIRIPKVMQSGKVDGLIFLGQINERYIHFMVQQTQLPVIFLDAYIPRVIFDTVISDGYYGTYILTNYLIGQGHRRIGFVGRVDATSSISDRYWGYRKALRENLITYKDEWEIPDRDEVGNTLETIVENADGMDAFVCNCDATAHVLIQNLEERGYRIPEDISIVGFDDFLPLGTDNSRITTYAVDMERMADLCVKTLIRKINGKKYVEGIQIVTGRIIHKKSVAKRD